jgi:hypothetical protein
MPAEAGIQRGLPHTVGDYLIKAAAGACERSEADNRRYVVGDCPPDRGIEMAQVALMSDAAADVARMF